MTSAPAASVVIAANLLTIPAPVIVPVPAVVLPAQKPKSKPPVPRKKNVIERAEQVQASAQTTRDAAPADSTQPTDVATTESAVPLSSEVVSLAPDIPTTPEPPQAGPERPGYQVKPPPSAALTYDVHALRDGTNWYGTGEISWKIDGPNYVVTGEASISALVFKITALNFSSTGSIDEFGVAPLLYSETRFRKSATNTHFRHGPDIISFSASTATYPRASGAQDRASVIWQLSAIGNGDPGKFVPGAEIELFVAGVRDAEPWRIQVVNEETIEVGTGPVATWHVARAPRPGSYEQKIDIWLAPNQHWYPVRILYTERNGDTLNMSLSKLDGATSIKE